MAPNPTNGVDIFEPVQHSDIVRFTNCLSLHDGQLVSRDVFVEAGRIISPENLFYVRREPPRWRVDCGGAIVAPGFIDLQRNGGWGVDFSSPQHHEHGTGEAVQRVAAGVLQQGVTAFLPTLVTSPSAVYAAVLPHLAARAGGAHGAAIVGAHLEGPFINPLKRGAHALQHVQSFCESGSACDAVCDAVCGDDKPTSDGAQSEARIWQRVLSLYGGSVANVAMVTLAPELAGACHVIRQLRASGVVVSVGHSDGSLRAAERAYDAGASMMTHLFNAMTQFHHRDPGLVGLLTSRHVAPHSLYYGVIADGIHTHPAALRLAWRALPSAICLVTDAISAAGLSPGLHRIGTQLVHVMTDGRALLAAEQEQSEGAERAGSERESERGGKKERPGAVGGTLAGSIVSMDACVRHMVEATGCSKAEALEAASLHPAQVLGQTPDRGTLLHGARADLVVLSADLHVLATFIDGRCVYMARCQPNDQLQLRLVPQQVV